MEYIAGFIIIVCIFIIGVCSGVRLVLRKIDRTFNSEKCAEFLTKLDMQA